MKILVPDHIPEEVINEIKDISKQIQVLRLAIIENENILRKVLRKIAVNILSYNLYKTFYFIYRPKKRYVFLVDNADLNEQLTDVDVFLASWVINNDMFNTLLDYLPNLRWVHSTKAGVEHLEGRRVAEGNITVTSSKGIHSRRIAEFVLGCIFEASKHISNHIALTRKRRWTELPSEELEGKTVGILGAGSIGTEVAKKAKALGMKTIGYNKSVKQIPYFDEIVYQPQLKRVLEISDFLVICLPLTRETEGSIGESELSSMKPSAYIINVGRSKIIQEKAILNALRRKKIAGAFLDVFHPEMQLPNHPYYKLDNVFLTHYSAHSSERSDDEIFDRFISNTIAFLQNKPLLGRA